LKEEIERMLNGLGLFAGIGGLEIGLERAGLVSPVCFVEKDAYAQKVLAKRFPEVPIWDDVTTFDGKAWKGYIDFISGGFPCQDVSASGKQEGIKSGTRSGLWFEFKRIVGEIRPTMFVAENVAAILIRGGVRVIADLAEIGYNAEWCVISASEMGAPHLRERVFILAYANTDCVKRENTQERQDSVRLSKCMAPPKIQMRGCEPPILGDDHGIPNRVDRLKCLGNAVVPQCAEYIGRLIMDRIML
jgi:DNA (cytosine-5)-methyltransferase 1